MSRLKSVIVLNRWFWVGGLSLAVLGCATGKVVPPELDHQEFGRAESLGVKTVAITYFHGLKGRFTSEDPSLGSADGLDARLRQMNAQWGGQHVILVGPRTLTGTEATHWDSGQSLLKTISTWKPAAASFDQSDQMTGISRISEWGKDHSVVILDSGTQQFSKGGLEFGLISIHKDSDLKWVRAEAESLRNRGSKIIIGLVDETINCSPSPTDIKTFLPGNDSGACKTDAEKILSKLPANTISLVLARGVSKAGLKWIANTPIVAPDQDANSIATVFMSYSSVQSKVVSEWTRVQLPIRNCTTNSDGECPPFLNKRPRRTGTFEGQLQIAKRKQDELMETPIGFAARAVTASKNEASDFPILMADSIRAETRSDLSLVPGDFCPLELRSGPFKYRDLYQSCPGPDHPVSIKVTGEQLRKLIEIMFSGQWGISGISGGKVKLLATKRKGTRRDLDRNRKVETWERNRVVSFRFEDGSRIRNAQHYRVSLPESWTFRHQPHFGYMAKQEWLKERSRSDKRAFDLMLGRILNAGPLNTTTQPIRSVDKPRIEQ